MPMARDVSIDRVKTSQVKFNFLMTFRFQAALPSWS